MLNGPGKRALTTSSLRDARGAELKRRRIKRSIRIDRRRGISRTIRRVRSCHRDRELARSGYKRAAFIRNAKGKEEKVALFLLLDFSLCRFQGKSRCPSSLLSAEIQYFGYRIQEGRNIVPLSTFLFFFFWYCIVPVEIKRMTLELFSIEAEDQRVTRDSFLRWLKTGFGE